MAISSDDVKAGFRFILGREPDNDEVVQHFVSSCDTISTLRHHLLHSEEATRRLCLDPPFYLAGTPGRYGVNFERYIERGGLVRPEEDSASFLARGGNGDLARFYALALCADLIAKEGIDGDFAELGVYKGATAAVWAQFTRRLNRHLYLFDTFEGFSQKDLVDVDAKVDFQFKDTSLESVQKLIGTKGVSYVVGRFPETVDQISDALKFALVHIDCDLYAPIKSSLEYFWPRLAPGGIVIVHDYSSLFWDGAEKAVDEFFSARPERVVLIPDSSGTCIVRKSA